MSLDDCINLGSENGYTTLNDCIQHVETHAGQLFEWNKVEAELDELHEEVKAKFPIFYREHFSNGWYIFEKEN